MHRLRKRPIEVLTKDLVPFIARWAFAGSALKKSNQKGKNILTAGGKIILGAREGLQRAKFTQTETSALLRRPIVRRQALVRLFKFSRCSPSRLIAPTPIS